MKIPKSAQPKTDLDGHEFKIDMARFEKEQAEMEKKTAIGMSNHITLTGNPIASVTEIELSPKFKELTTEEMKEEMLMAIKDFTKMVSSITNAQLATFNGDMAKMLQKGNA